MIKRLLYIFIFTVAAQVAGAQQLPLYSQYLYNKFIINPAYAGSDGFTSFNLTARQQWVGYDGAPRTYSLSWQTRILKRGYKLGTDLFNRTVYRAKTEGKIGFGGYVFSDKNALVNRNGFQATYSYHFWVQDYTQLSMGISFTGYHLRINADENSFESPDEPWLLDNMRKGVFIPDSEFGLYLLNPHFDLGFSAHQLFGAAAKIGTERYRNYEMYRHINLFGSYNFNFGTKTELKPSAFVRMSEQLRPQIDLGLTYTYNQSFWAGFSYRSGGAIIGNFGFKYINSRIEMTSIYFGYSFDYTLNQIQTLTYGTHEITMALKFGDTSKKFRWLDRF